MGVLVLYESPKTTGMDTHQYLPSLAHLASSLSHQIVGRGVTDLGAQEGLSQIRKAHTTENNSEPFTVITPGSHSNDNPNTNHRATSLLLLLREVREISQLCYRTSNPQDLEQFQQRIHFPAHSFPTNPLAGHHRRISGERSPPVTLLPPSPLLLIRFLAVLDNHPV